ncbi:MAG TPA: DUF1501 domain-containing protein [Planctomycetaceae bacterium]|nr:DUF1501 domain-containing protein [Planctomycetaceae bacterium]
MLRIGSDLTSRRDFLTVGGLALGGLSLPSLLRTRALAAQQKLSVTDKSVIFVFMHGGPSQIETFDPKMTASPGICSVNGEVATSLPGVTYGSAFPRLAARAHETTVVRSFKTGDGNHDIKPIVGKATGGANLGTLYARVAGGNRPRSGMPTNVILYPRAIDPSAQPRIRQFGDFETAGPFGGAYSPFAPSGGGDLKSDLKIHLPMDRIDDRRHLLAGLDRIRRSLDSDGGMQGIDRLRQQAFDTLLGGVADAFNLSREDPGTIRRYDTAPLVRPDQINKRLHNYPYYVDNAKTLGKLLLLARRLCERGCGFVTVTTSFVWDMHADVNNAGVDEGMRYMAPPFDHAVSAFLEDVAARGLSEKILLVCCGEMGRTPRINSRGGRDHWGNLAPLLLAGGGLKMGRVIGQSTRDAAEPLTDPITIPHLVATVLHALFDVGQLRVTPGVPREIVRAATGIPPIGELI